MHINAGNVIIAERFHDKSHFLMKKNDTLL